MPIPDTAASAQKLVITYLPLNSLNPTPVNPRAHDKKHIRQLKESIKTFGFITPLVINTANNIICGHGRYYAAVELGLAQLPTVCAAHLTEAQAKAFMIADNKLTDNSVWDDQLLAQNLKELKTLGIEFNLEVIGFSMDEIDFRIGSLDMAQNDASDRADQVPDIDVRFTVSEVGDEWLLGKNRILHADATKLTDIERLMNGQRAAVVFTDPPYGVNYANSPQEKMRGVERPILNDNLGDGFGEFLYSACFNILSVTDGGIYICMSSSALATLQSAFIKAGGHWSTFIIWAKQTFTLGRSDYQRQYEPILYGWTKGAERYWCGARDQSDVWFINKPVKNDLHPTMKPVELVMRALRNSSKRGDIVLDPFLGSGSTLIAAERTGRVCYGMELDPHHVDTSIRRWQRHTGDAAIHAATGKIFDLIAEEKGTGHVA